MLEILGHCLSTMSKIIVKLQKIISQITQLKDQESRKMEDKFIELAFKHKMVPIFMALFEFILENCLFLEQLETSLSKNLLTTRSSLLNQKFM